MSMLEAIEICLCPSLPSSSFPASSPQRKERELRKSKRKFMPQAAVDDQRSLTTESDWCRVWARTMNTWPQPDKNHLIPTDYIIMSNYMYFSFRISNLFASYLSVFVSLNGKNTIKRTISQPVPIFQRSILSSQDKAGKSHCCGTCFAQHECRCLT